MRAPVAPRLEKRRSSDFLAELRERSRAWIPEWDLSAEQGDFGHALLDVAARFSSEISERLDRAGDKMRAGFLDWLGVRGKAARPARVPVVFKLSDSAPAAVDAIAPIRLQASAGAPPVVFETEKSVTIIPAKLQMIVAADPENDAYYLPPPDLTSLAPIEQGPVHWTVKSFAPAGATALQLMPGIGLSAGMLIKLNGRQYTIKTADKDLITLDRPLESAATQETEVDKVRSFEAFDAAAANQQEHILYIGDGDLFNIKAAATFGVENAGQLRAGVQWEYWGKRADLTPPSDEVKWQPLEPQRAVPSDPGTLLLEKPAGEIAQKDIDGKSARWIRAYAPTIGAADEPIRAEEFAIRINPSQCGSGPTVCPPTTVVASPAAEAMANTTPLVLDNMFLPLGREPRQFDAFYLGSPEAFSKRGAQVRICFELADPTFASLAVVREGLLANIAIAGVGKDRALHIFSFDPATQAMTRYAGRDALRPPLPGDGGTPPAQTTQVSLNPQCRPVITTSASDFSIQVAAGGSIWTWHERVSSPTLSGWMEFERLPEVDPPHRVDDIVPVSQANTRVVLSNCALWVHDGSAWDQKPTVDPALNHVTLAAVVPVLLNASGALVPSAMMVGVSADNLLYFVAINGDCKPLALHFGPGDDELVDAGDGAAGTCKTGGIRPAAYSEASGLLAVVTANDKRDKLVAYVDPPGMGITAVFRIDLPANDVVGGSTVDISLVNSSPQFSVLCKRPDDSTYIASWQPLDPTLRTILFSSPTPGSGRLNGAPVTLPAHVVAPGTRGDLLVASFDPLQRRLLTTDPAEDGAVLPKTNPLFTLTDEFSVFDATSARILRAVAAAGLNIPPDTEVLYPVAATFGPVSSDLDLLAYRSSASQFTGIIIDADNITLDNVDSETIVGTVLLIDVTGTADVYMVVDDTNYPDVNIVPSLPATSGNANYWTPESLAARVAPIVRLDPITGNWDASLVRRAQLYFPTANPQVQRAKAFEIDTATNQPRTLALSTPWTVAPAAGDLYIIDSAIGQWEQVLSDTSTNPELSWEYSNGTGWGSLLLEEEGTLNLKNTGAIRFTVPDDIAATDWAGKTSHWIRARLIGGDYGREKVTVKTKYLASGETEQTIERSPEGIRPPAVVALHISYGFCAGVTPKFVLTEDSGSRRDQSDANRTPGAIVEAFVPLAVALKRLLQPAGAIGAGASTELCPPICDCPGDTTTLPTSAPAIAAPSTTSSAPAPGTSSGGPCLFLGIDGTVAGSDVHVLILTATEHNYTPFAPLEVQAIVANRFTQLVASDGTRALGESGLIEMSFAIPPSKTDLFGQSLVWLRLLPRGGATPQTWLPAIAGIYLNAVYARSTETLTRELLGSADGSPNLTVTLARPPVLDGTLELRVREPLGDQELEDLKDRGLVVTEGSNCWVLWRQVDDTTDEPAGERVYSLDESIGEIRFGDGLHGMIPPIGRDSIVAFSYQRTEPSTPGTDVVPANGIRARTTLNLVSPVESVESVTTAADSAGGSAPETTDAVLQFGYARLRHRERALTVEDFEDLALESSPSIAQARALQVSRGRVRVVIVMRGDPLPTQSQIRELRRNLLSQAPAALALPEALTVSAPTLRELRIQLGLDIESLDKAAEVSVDVKDRLKALFDTVTGNLTHDGWPLGLAPSEDVVASAISNVPGLASTTVIEFSEIDEKGDEHPWPQRIRATDLVVLADDAVRLEFHSLEVAA